MRLGIDLGSRSVKLVYGNSIQTLQYKKYDTVYFYKNFCMKEDAKFYLKTDFIDAKTITFDEVVATGYGRNIIAFENVKIINELEAHVKGVLSSTTLDTFTLVDIGGQDTKIINVKNKVMHDFYMNDKCAAGSGRYLENMAKILDVTLDEMSKYYENPVPLSKTCAIFGESEVISAVSQGIPYPEIMAGVNYSVFERLKRFILEYNNEKIVFVGGVAKNFAIGYFMREILYKEVYILENPEYNGAFGCYNMEIDGK